MAPDSCLRLGNRRAEFKELPYTFRADYFKTQKGANMQSIKRYSLGCLLALLALNLFSYSRSTATVPADTPPSSAEQEQPTQALLEEVRQLRLAIQRSNLGTFRAQVILERLRLQTERVNNLRELVERGQEEIANAKSNRPRMTDRLKDLEAQIEVEKDETRRAQFVAERTELRYALEQLSDQEQQQQDRENQLTSQLQVEQSKLDEINNKLDAMEAELRQPQDAPQQNKRRP